MPGETVMKNGHLDIPSKIFAKDSPLAQKLFEIEGVNRVFLGKDYISVSKTEESKWTNLEREVKIVIEDTYINKRVIVIEKEPQEMNADDPVVVQLVKEILDTRVRPSVWEDGGDI